jgi:hypothetical protein
MRNIYIVNATQVVTSQAHPEGAYSVVSGYPKTFDSRSYAAPDGNPNGNSDTALIVAQAEFADEVKDLATANNPNRVMWAVTLEQANGVQIMRKAVGAFPDMTPEPEPSPEPEAE